MPMIETVRLPPPEHVQTTTDRISRKYHAARHSYRLMPLNLPEIQLNRNPDILNAGDLVSLLIHCQEDVALAVAVFQQVDRDRNKNKDPLATIAMSALGNSTANTCLLVRPILLRQLLSSDHGQTWACNGSVYLKLLNALEEEPWWGFNHEILEKTELKLSSLMRSRHMDLTAMESLCDIKGFPYQDSGAYPIDMCWPFIKRRRRSVSIQDEARSHAELTRRDSMLLKLVEVKIAVTSCQCTDDSEGLFEEISSKLEKKESKLGVGSLDSSDNKKAALTVVTKSWDKPVMDVGAKERQCSPFVKDRQAIIVWFWDVSQLGKVGCPLVVINVGMCILEVFVCDFRCGGDMCNRYSASTLECSRKMLPEMLDIKDRKDASLGSKAVVEKRQIIPDDLKELGKDLMNLPLPEPELKLPPSFAISVTAVC
ncbi:hypothetical protein BT69DRAFT_1301582 [Atractiella rhizophila]|nr:hypothetical protein BT69DRAFT_1301582 [Atractiella rhizophila]